MGRHRFSAVLDAPIDIVYAWHARPGALERLTPPWQPVTVGHEAPSLADGSRAVLRLPLGIPWVAEHSGYDPPHAFVDRLTSLPLDWRHTHRFVAEGERTRVIDEVETPVPAALLRPMFAYRYRQLADDLAAHRWAADRGVGPMTIALTGASGLIGSALGAFLTTGGHRVRRLVRRAPRTPDEARWDPTVPDPAAFTGVDAVVHLAGASIAGRFTDAHKRAITESRVEPTRRLAEALAALPDGPRTLVVASAIGYYGADRGDEWLTEQSAAGDGFLAGVVHDWEDAADPARAAGLRVAHVRTGIVQSPRGGTLRLLRPLFAAGLGGPLGDGRQWLSWIGLDDLVDVYHRALVDDTLAGPVNAVTPYPVRNAEYTRTLARVLRRPAVLAVPGFGPRLLLGAEGAAELVYASQRVVPDRLGDHPFRHPHLDGALRHLLGRARLA